VYFSASAPSPVQPIDGPPPLMRPRPLEACTPVMGRHPAAASAQVGTADQMHSMLCRWGDRARCAGDEGLP
ncbi:Dihydrolipoamide acyltransferase, partial [Giardia duodenalis]